MITVYSQYKNQEEADAAHKKRETFSKENDYEVYEWNTCYDCMNFMVDLHTPQYGGNCKCMEQAGAYPGVLSHAVCDKFLSCKGLDINNEPVDPSEYPAWVRIKEYWGKKKDKVLLESDLRKYAAKDLIAVNLIRLFNIEPEIICDTIREYINRNSPAEENHERAV